MANTGNSISRTQDDRTMTAIHVNADNITEITGVARLQIFTNLCKLLIIISILGYF